RCPCSAYRSLRISPPVSVRSASRTTRWSPRARRRATVLRASFAAFLADSLQTTLDSSRLTPEIGADSPRHTVTGAGAMRGLRRLIRPWILLLALTACAERDASGTDPLAPEPQYGGTLVIANNSDLTDLN